MSERPLRIVSYNVRYFGHALRGLATTRTSLERIAQKLTTLTPPPQAVEPVLQKPC